MTSHITIAETVRSRIGTVIPRVALVLGSGLASVTDIIEQPRIFAYEDLEGFPRSTVAGHNGRLLIGTVEGVEVACLQGRHHAYEGHTPATLALPIRCLNALGCQTVLLTNAAGSLRTDLPAGELMLITDHINWAGVNPLIGPNNDSIGPRFIDMNDAWCAELRKRMQQIARQEAIDLQEGVYLMAHGPNFETPAEVRAMALLGGDAVGMSTVPECLVARHCGMRVLGLSLITNLGAGLVDQQTLDHEETLAAGAHASSRVARLLKAFVPMFGDGLSDT